jgi:hypothetical protein
MIKATMKAPPHKAKSIQGFVIILTSQVGPGWHGQYGAGGDCVCRRSPEFRIVAGPRTFTGRLPSQRAVRVHWQVTSPGCRDESTQLRPGLPGRVRPGRIESLAKASTCITSSTHSMTSTPLFSVTVNCDTQYLLLQFIQVPSPPARTLSPTCGVHSESIPSPSPGSAGFQV